MKNNKTTLIFLAVTFVLFVIVKILPKYKPSPTHTTGKIQIDESSSSNYAFRHDGNAWIIGKGDETLSVLQIEIASTFSEIEKGLTYRPTMKPNNGMLFIFEEAAPQSFWMKNTYLSLDFVFIDEKGVIKEIIQNTKPESLTPISSTLAIKYVLEVNSGFVARNGIMKGSKLTFEKK